MTLNFFPVKGTSFWIASKAYCAEVMIQWETSAETIKSKREDYFQMWLLSIPTLRDVSRLLHEYSIKEEFRFRRGDIENKNHKVFNEGANYFMIVWQKTHVLFLCSFLTYFLKMSS